MLGRLLFGTRPDGDKVKDLSPTRAIMPFLFRTRTECTVYFELLVDGKNVRRFIEQERARTGRKVTLLHVVVLAVARILEQRPRLNRFCASHRIYQRRGIWISFSAKTEKSDKGAVVALKKRIDPTWDLQRVMDVVDGVVGDSRRGKKDTADKEMALALAFPTFITSLAVRFLHWAGQRGLLPLSMIDGDPLFSSMFIANLGSIDMDAPFHHLYEWGNIPLFCAIGRERADGMIPFRFTFDERIEDGLYCLGSLQILRAMLEEPEAAFATSEMRSS